MESQKKLKTENENNRNARNWITTINNPNGGARQQFDLVRDNPSIKYAVGQEEKGLEGTPHLQVFTNWSSSIRLSKIRQLWPTGHHEICIDRSSAILYCQKQESRVDGPWIYGVDPVTRHPNGKKTLKQLLQCTEDELQELGPNAYLAAKKAIAIMPGEEYVPESTRGLWIYGPPGTGKSRYCFDSYPNSYRKAQNKWWDGYAGEKVVVLDDLDRLGGQTLGHYLKIWGDRYPCRAEVKGFTIQLRHDLIVVTSNYSIEQIWPDDIELQKAIRRRFVVRRFVMCGNGGLNVITASGDAEITRVGQLTLDDEAGHPLGLRVRGEPECMQQPRSPELDRSGDGSDSLARIFLSDTEDYKTAEGESVKIART